MRYLLASVLGLCVAATAYVEAADVNDLVKKLSDSDVDVRRAAAKELGDMGAEAKAAVPALRKSLRDRDLFVRRFGLEALGKIGPEAKAAVPEMALALRDEKKEVALAAAEALGNMGPAAVPSLTAAVKDAEKDPQVRKKAALSLGKIGGPARSAVPVLADVLSGKGPATKKKGKDLNDTDVRVEAATALGSLAKPEDKDAIEALKGVSEGKQKNKALQKVASDSLRKITGMAPKKK